MAHNVFLSYSQKDKATADAVCRALERNSVRVWMAPRDIPVGAVWSEHIPKAIIEAQALVLIFSAGANTSSYIPRELTLAAEKNKPIIPIRLANVMPSGSIGFFISTSHWLDAFPPPLESHLSNIVEMTRNALGVRPESPLPVTKQTPRPAARASSAPAALPAATSENRPTRNNRRKIVAVVAGIVVLVAAAVSFKSLTSATVATLAPDSDCSADNTASDPGAEPGGLFKVVRVDTLKVDNLCVPLSRIGTIVSDQVASLDQWMHSRGVTVQCDGEEPFNGRYNCYIGNDHADVSDFVLSRGWAKPMQNTAAQN